MPSAPARQLETFKNPNPGRDYEHTRHNAGADVVALLASRHGGRLRLARRERSLVAEVAVDGRRLALAFPQTYMNDSGQAVALLLRRFGISSDLHRLVIVHDGAQSRMCFSVNAGTLRLSAGTSFERALDGVGADDAENHSTVIVFSLSVKVTLELFVVRDHPSGTFTTNPPFDE